MKKIYIKKVLGIIFLLFSMTQLFGVMSVFGTYIYAGGDMNIHKYDTNSSDSTYVPAISPYLGALYSLARDGNYIYAGGSNQKIYKFSLFNEQIVSESSNYGGDIQSLIIDGDYIYAGGWNTRTIKKYNKSDLSFVSESSNYGGNIQSLLIDGDYIYVGGTNVIKKYNKTDLSFISQTSILGLSMYSIIIEGDYIYAGGTAQKIRKYNKFDMSFISESPNYGGRVQSLLIDGDYIYAGGWNTRTIRKYNKSDLSFVSESPSHGGNIQSLLIDGDYIYVGGFYDINTMVSNRIKKYNKSNLSFISEIEIYAVIYSMIKYEGPIKCGTASKNYLSTDTTFSGTFCESGTQISNPIFPGLGGTSTWTCQGENGGATVNCEATRESNIQPPNSLKQYIKLPEAPTLEKQEIPLATKVGKYQSGSGIILSAYVENSTSTQLRLEFEIYRLGESMPSIQVNTNYFLSGTGEVVVPYLGVGEYYWKVRTKSINGPTSDWVDYNTNYPWEYDYTLFEGFEPYPYGYRFENSSPANGFLSKILNGRVTYGTRNDGLIGRIKVPGNKWDIFESAFDTSMYHTFSNDTKLFDAFEFYGLNSDNAFQGGSCYGMALSSAMQFSHSGFLSESFSNNVGTGMIWNKINRLETKFEDGKYKWSKYDDTLKTIFALQLSQFSSHQNAKRLDYDTPINIFNTLNNNPDKIYLLNFWWEQPKLLYGTGYYGHAVIPYRVEIRNDSRRIYFWDNNVPYDGTSQNLAYEQYIDINFDGTVTSSRYNFAPFRDISLVNIDDLYNNGNKSFPGGFAGLDLAFSLSGNSDLYVEDNLGRKSGFLQGNIYEEIPGVNVIIPYNTGEEENTWKQIYLPEKQNLTVKVVGKSQENYDLMIAGGDYYTKLEGVKTSMGELDSFISTRENVKIDFDNSKTGTYNLLVDNFYNNGTGSIFMQDMPIIGNKISYNINWSKVLNNSNDAVIYGLDINNDGTNDYEQELPPLYQYSIATLMSKPTSIEDYDNSEGK